MFYVKHSYNISLVVDIQINLPLEYISLNSFLKKGESHSSAFSPEAIPKHKQFSTE